MLLQGYQYFSTNFLFIKRFFYIFCTAIVDKIVVFYLLMCYMYCVNTVTTHLNAATVALGLWESGVSRQEVARRLGVSQSVVSRFWNCYYQLQTYNIL